MDILTEINFADRFVKYLVGDQNSDCMNIIMAIKEYGGEVKNNKIIDRILNVLVDEKCQYLDRLLYHNLHVWATEKVCGKSLEDRINNKIADIQFPDNDDVIGWLDDNKYRLLSFYQAKSVCWQAAEEILSR